MGLRRQVSIFLRMILGFAQLLELVKVSRRSEFCPVLRVHCSKRDRVEDVGANDFSFVAEKASGQTNSVSWTFFGGSMLTRWFRPCWIEGVFDTSNASRAILRPAANAMTVAGAAQLPDAFASYLKL